MNVLLHTPARSSARRGQESLPDAAHKYDLLDVCPGETIRGKGSVEFYRDHLDGLFSGGLAARRLASLLKFAPLTQRRSEIFSNSLALVPPEPPTRAIGRERHSVFRDLLLGLPGPLFIPGDDRREHEKTKSSLSGRHSPSARRYGRRLNHA
jgi:hypothetical protein